MRNLFQKITRQHQTFTVLMLLFVSFRALTLLAYRPGGLILDFSDFYFYREFSQISRQGYIAYDTLWTTYPPLFPLLMLGVWKISALLPPWEFNNLIFTLLLGGTFLVFETGDFILLYLMALEIYPRKRAHIPAMIYAGLFVPVYSLTGWFESYPLFFFLLSLYLLMKNRPWLSAFFSGVGFMVKLIPVILLPLGAKIVPAKTKWRLRIPLLNVDFDVGSVTLYVLIFAGTVIAIGIPFYRMNPDLIFRPLQMTGGRPPWETIWALIEGNYTYGIIPLDMRNLTWPLPPTDYEPRLPWLWITAAFGVAYAFLYTRRIEWRQPRPLLGFAGVTLCFFLLYSKGYSPQWLGWLLVFSSLLLPNLRGTIYAVILCVANLVEANIYFTIFPSEHWLLAATVLIRTGLIVVLALEFCLLIWPQLEKPSLVEARRRVVAAGLVALALALIPAGLRLNAAYFDLRLEQSPYRATVSWLREQPVTEAILLNSHTTYDWFYPYLRQTHAFYMLDDYPQPPVLNAKTNNLLTEIAAQHNAVWIYDSDPAQTSPAEEAVTAWLGNRSPAHQADIDGGRLYLYILQSPTEQ